jgi:hypothetical protein
VNELLSYPLRTYRHPYLNCLPGDHIAVKGCSVQHVMDILHACGVEISEGKTLLIKDEKKMVSLDGSESMVKVVRGMHMILGHMSLCCIPLDIFVRYPT